MKVTDKKNSVKALMLNWQFFVISIALLAIILSILFQTMGASFANIPLWVVIFLGGISAVLRVMVKLAKGNLGADSLSVVAIVTAVILHQYLAAVIVILMVASGQAFEIYAMRKASAVLLALAERMPNIAHRKTANNIIDISLNDVQVGDHLVIYPHETCPADGIVIEGQGSMNEAYLTGEPYEISKIPGAAVLSGAINGNVALIVQVTKVPAESRYASIVAVLEEAEKKRPTLRRLGDQIGGVFSPIAFIFALVVWYYTGDTMRFLAVLVIATPCPLLIAIPVTMISAISIAAKHAIIIKDPTVLERLPTCRTVIFDKTGTLTYGKPVLTELINSTEISSDLILQQVASLERYSKHPLAGAILRAAEQKNLALLNATSVTEQPGKGLSGIVENNYFQVTNRKKLLAMLPALEKILPPFSSGLECIILKNNQYVATLHFKDMPRKESKLFIHHLKPLHQFNKMMLVSGDRDEEVQYIGNILNISELYASQTPEQKLAIVQSEMKKSATLFIGDGINDAPSLTAATVGIAFGEFSNVTAEAAGAVIMENSLAKVDELMHLSKKTRDIALQSAIGGMIFSLIGMGFAAGGYITPIVGAVLQEIIDVVAIMNAMRLIWLNNIEIDFTKNIE